MREEIVNNNVFGWHYNSRKEKKEYLQQLAGIRILVVDDDSDLLDIFSKMLRLFGLEVTTAGNGFEGLNLFLEGAYDLVLTDLEMPGMDGRTLSRIIKEKSPGRPVIMMTGNTTLGHKDRCNGSIDALIFKPFPMADLKKVIFKVL